MNFVRGTAPQSVANMEFVKKIYYFNRQLEELNNERMDEKRKEDVLETKKDADALEEKLQRIVIKNKTGLPDSKGIFAELKKGLVSSSSYNAVVPIIHSIENGEKRNGKFDHIMNRHRYQSMMLDKITA